MSDSTRKSSKNWLCFTPLILIGLGFAFALLISVVALIDGFAASREWSGDPGTVTMLKERSVPGGRGRTICEGEFVFDSGGSVKQVEVLSPGACVIDKKMPARFVKGKTMALTKDSAWISGSNDWIGSLMMTVLFSILTFLFTLPIFSWRKKLREDPPPHSTESK